MENLNKETTELVEKAVETLEPVAKEVAKVGHSTLKKAGLYVAGIVTGIGGTKLVEKIAKREKKTDKKHWWQKDKNIVLPSQPIVVDGEVQAQPEE